MTRGLVLRAAFGVALAAAVAWAGLIILTAGANGTLGFDYRAYDLAVDNLLAGRTMYDPNATATGSFGLFFYPPPFALLILPLALLPAEVGVWLWTGALAAATIAAVALLPLSARTRWLVLLLAALSWPLVYAIKLGQVGPVLLLLFAVGWRWMDRPWVLGSIAGLGTVIKVQPAVLIAWAIATGRRRAALIALGVVFVLAAVATVVAGPQSWLDEASLLGRVSQPVQTPHGVGIARIAYEAGVPETVATLVHWAHLVGVVAIVAFVVWQGSAVAGYLAVVVASQLLSPVLWDHYALVLLLPVAWLLERRQWWAALVPLATSTMLIGLSPPIAYPIGFWMILLGLAWAGRRPLGASPVTAA